MRKWLSMCGAVALYITSGSSIVSCNNKPKFVAKQLSFFPEAIRLSAVNAFVSNYNTKNTDKTPLNEISTGTELGTFYVYLVYAYINIGTTANAAYLTAHESQAPELEAKLLLAPFDFTYVALDSLSEISRIEPNNTTSPSDMVADWAIEYFAIYDAATPDETFRVQVVNDL